MEITWSFESTVAAAGAQGSARPTPGQRFAEYQILGVLGEGANGIVYRAADSVGRQVALKVLKATLDERSRARFQREGEITATLNHPGVLRILAGGEAGGLPFLVYELVEGAASLDAFLCAAPFEETARVFCDLADAVGHAHRNGVVHRDLKPENVLVDAQGRVFVMDFGLARLGDSDGEGLTKTGAMIGTPCTMSPEQLMGERALVGPHSDVWSLGVMLYQCLCGRLPFPAPSWVELQVMVARHEPERPSDLAPGVPADLESICLKALRKAPADRYPDAAALHADLQAYLSGERPSASSQRQLPLAVRRLRPLLLAGTPLLLALGALGLVLSTTPAPVSELPVGSPSRPLERSPERPLERSPARSADPERAESEFSALRRLQAPEEKIAAARAWLAEHADAAARGRVEQFLRRLERAHPVRVFHHGVAAVNPWFVDEDTLWSVGEHGTSRTWDIVTGKQLEVRERAYGYGNGSFSSAAVRGGVAVADETLGLRWLQGGETVEAADLLGVACMAAAPDGQQVAVARAARDVVVYDVATRAPTLTTPRLRSKIYAVAFSPSGEQLAVSSGAREVLNTRPNSVTVFRVRDGSRGVDLDVGPLVRALAFHDERTLLLGTNTGLIDAWDLERRTRAYAFEALEKRRVRGPHAGSVRRLLYSADRRLLLSVGVGKGKDNEFVVWDVATRRMRVEPRERPRRLEGGDLSPSGKLLAIGSRDGVVEVWAVPR